jgi:membrane protein YqaA with SNARE-associated domain
MTDTNNDNNRGVGVLSWLRGKIVPLVGLLAVIAIVVCVFYFYWRNPGMFKELKAYGYFGAFVITIILNASILLPVSSIAVVMTLGATLPSSVLVGVAGGLGAAVGEMTGYVAGRSGRGLLAKSNMYNRVESWVARWGWIAVFIMSVFPLVFDIVGIIAGALRFPLWKFLVACALGRIISYVVMATLASWGVKLLPWFS